MTTLTRPHGRLPARVYWFRRGLVVLTAAALVLMIVDLLGGSGGANPATRARVAAARTTPTPTANAPVGPVSLGGPGSPKATGTAPAGPLAQPDGPCGVNDITVTPVVGSQVAGGPVPLTLQLTGIRPACTFAVSSSSIVAKVSRGTARVWSSQDCPSSVPASSVIVRSAAPTTVVVTWSGRGSDPTCSRATEWALPGTYSAEAAAIGSAPTGATFVLKSPPRPVVTVTVHPKTKKASANTAVTPNAGR